ncbi:hypothetical protein ABZ490_22695 [Streptomyces sp. NPDC005811]|uniref:hypothetical protein n=1 Tax=Streptomyces sp. NPDC005811 TaxID=3154565 RepID=UPI0033C95297
MELRPTASGSAIITCRHDDLVGRFSAASLAVIADLAFVGPDGGGDDSSEPAVITACKKPSGEDSRPRRGGSTG